MKETNGLYIKPVEMGVVDNSLVMKFRTDRNKLKPDDFHCYVYAEDYFLMCTGTGENLPTFRRGTICLNMKSQYLWLPGTYKLIFALADVYIDSSAPRVPFIALSEYRRFTLRDFS